MSKNGYIYILTNANHTVLYVGVTSDLENRMCEHKNGLIKTSFTYKYGVKELVYFEEFQTIQDAIDLEKQLKAGSRQRKLDLINAVNPNWEDLTLTL